MKPDMIDKEIATSLISKKDEYVCNFSEFDLQCRLGTLEKVSKTDYLEFLSHQTLNWTEIEKETISKIFEELEDAYRLYEKCLEDTIRLIKITGREESDAAYTRDNIIYIPLSIVQWPYNELKELIAHELFHVISSNHPDLRKNWYTKLGFFACPELEIPEVYKNLYVTNPDTIGKNCYVEVQHNGSKVRAVPFLYSENPYKGGYFFRYFSYAFLVSEMKNGKCMAKYEKEELQFITVPQSLWNLCEELDPYSNQHRLHPEEILAYYWSYLPFSKSELGPYKHNFLSKIQNKIF